MSCEINLSTWKPDVDTLQRFLLHKDKKIISFWANINCQYRIKSFWRRVNQKTFLLWKIFKMKTTYHYVKKFLLRKDKKMVSFWRIVNQKSFLLWNKSFKIKTTCHYIGKNSLGRRTRKWVFLWEYKSQEFFSLFIFRMKSFCRGDHKKIKYFFGRLIQKEKNPAK